MKQVAKLIIIDQNDNYLLMKRSDHPTFPNDPDLPGGTLEEGEEPLETMLREVTEEAGVTVNPQEVKHVYTGANYSHHGTVYHLYTTRVNERPEIIISWEHDSYDWMSKEEFLARVGGAADTYMQMVHDIIGQKS
ncbi:MAG TPA: NUDIX hydrolase [Candidatus Saccharimonadales bacterium]|nr:NUDIX hydrolase [Candidatus Saccharimonadales bacterium]